VKALIDFIVSQQESKMSGIVFVDQRATAAILQMLLSAHPDTKDLSYATFVGTSNPSSRRSQLGEIIDLNDQRNTLEDFRTRKCNVVIATSVLDEGIDISSCNLVVCYNKPANLKSFIQRRGRARERKSTFVLMLAQEDIHARSKNWEALEADMIKMYQDQRRELHMEELVDHGDRQFKVDSTG
jgi:ERCC4-related helicase